MTAAISSKGAYKSVDEMIAILSSGTSRRTAPQLNQTVAALYRGTNLRANGVASMPFDFVFKGGLIVSSDALRDLPRGSEWLRDIRKLLFQLEASLTLRGAAYAENMRNDVQTAGLKYLRANSMEPVFSESTGELLEFKRTMQETGEVKTLAIEDVVYFWPADEDVELGPAESFPGKAALASAGVLHNVDEFLGGYFASGMIKATVLQYSEEGKPLDGEEAAFLKKWWVQVTSGVRRAFGTVLLRDDFKPMTIGEGLKDIDNKALTDAQEKSVAIALGVPQTKLFQAANLATKIGDDVSFVVDTLVPEFDFIADTLNSQVLESLGIRLEGKHQRLSIMQTDEVARSQAHLNLVNAGENRFVSYEILGYDLPEAAVERMESELASASTSQAQALNGAQITGAISIAQAFSDGLLERDNAVSMISSGFNIPADVANSWIPRNRPVVTVEPATAPLLPPQAGRSAKQLEAERQFKAWYLKRDNPDITKFRGILTLEDKERIADELKAVKAIDPELAKLIDDAVKLFAGIYRNQRERVAGWLRTNGTSGLDSFFSDDTETVASESRAWFERNLSDSARQAFDTLNATNDFADVELVINTLAREMAADFAGDMSQTSLIQTETVVAEWLADGGTIGDLVQQLEDVWEGPRPDAAAVTESTRVLARGRVEAWKEIDGVTGYQPRTRNDDRVRPTHREFADAGPYELDDLEHLPPYGDVRCRCWVVASFD